MANQVLVALSPVQRAGLSSLQRAAIVDVERLGARRVRLEADLRVCEGRLREAATALVLDGGSPTVVGLAAGVTRGTVHKWIQRQRPDLRRPVPAAIAAAMSAGELDLGGDLG